MNRASATTSPFATHWIRPLRINAPRLDAFESSPGILKGAESLRPDLGSLFDNPMVLFNDIVEILALTQKSVAGGE